MKITAETKIGKKFIPITITITLDSKVEVEDALAEFDTYGDDIGMQMYDALFDEAGKQGINLS
jgi:hypothetical protein